jgi:Protein of unknown function (DUF3667)
MKCVNCETEIASNFCPVCGQRSGVKRITLRDSLEEFWIQVAGFDGIFFRTLKDLSRRPGYVAREYLNGVRVKYYGPITYFFFMITLLLVSLGVLGLDFAELIKSKQDAMDLTAKNNKAVVVVTQLIATNIKWFLFLAVPFQAFAARYVFFRKSGLNFAENTVPLFYTSGHLFWLTILTFGFRKLTGELFTVFVTVASIAYFGFVYSTLMTYQSKVKAFFKGIGVYLGGQVFFTLTMTIIIIIVVVILALFNPEALEQFRPSKQ